jgi:hypothetical protein
LRPIGSAVLMGVGKVSHTVREGREKIKNLTRRAKGKTVKKGAEGGGSIPQIPVLHKLDFVRDGQAVARTPLQRRRRYQRAQQNATAAARWRHRRHFLFAVAVAVAAIAVGRIRMGGGERGLVGLGEGEADLLVLEVVVVEAGHGTRTAILAPTWPVLPEDGLGEMRHCTRANV